MLSRQQHVDFCHGYDIVFGKVADDDVGETVQAVLDGLMPKGFALRLLFMVTNEKYCFCTEIALRHLRYQEARELG